MLYLSDSLRSVPYPQSRCIDAGSALHPFDLENNQICVLRDGHSPTQIGKMNATEIWSEVKERWTKRGKVSKVAERNLARTEGKLSRS